MTFVTGHDAKPPELIRVARFCTLVSMMFSPTFSKRSGNILINQPATLYVNVNVLFITCDISVFSLRSAFRSHLLSILTTIKALYTVQFRRPDVGSVSPRTTVSPSNSNKPTGRTHSSPGYENCAVDTSTLIVYLRVGSTAGCRYPPAG